MNLPLFDVIRCWWCYLLVILESEVLCLDQYGCIQLTKKSRVYLPDFFSLQLNLDTLYFIRPKMSVPLKEQTGPNSHFPFSMELLITFAGYHVSTYSPMTTWCSSIPYSSCSSLVGEKKL